MRSDNSLSITFGIVIGLLASFIQSLGLTIQRKSHVLNQSLPGYLQRVEHKRPLWLLGLAIFISSNVIGSFVQIAALPVVILAPLGAVSLLWNALFARLLLGDVFSPRMIIGTILIAGGAILIAFFGIVPEQTRSLDDLLALFRRPAFVAYFSVLGFIVIFCLTITHIAEFSLTRLISRASPPCSPASATIGLPSNSITPLDGLLSVSEIPSTERTPLIDPKSHIDLPSSSLEASPKDPSLQSIARTRLLLAISYASFSGIISGMCLLFAKSGVELLLLTLAGKNQFWRWEAWMLLLGLVAFALLQLWYLHKALTLADPTLVCPSAFCFYNLSSIVNGLVYFDQFYLIPPSHLSLVVLGIIILLGGVWVVSIQSGGGGVDVGSWNEDAVNLLGEDVAFYPEGETTGESLGTSGTETAICHRERTSLIGPVAMERGTVSEGNIQNVSFSRLDYGLPQSQGIVDPPSKRPRINPQLYASHRAPSSRLATGRPVIDPQGSSSSLSASQMHSRTISFPNPSYTQAPVPQALGTVSTLGPGFQIGLSPLSPGFTITPVERRGRPTFADVARGVVFDVRQRRRTVSEGQVLPRAREDINEGSSPPETCTSHIPQTRQADRDHTTSGYVSEAKTRWQWLKDIVTGKT